MSDALSKVKNFFNKNEYNILHAITDLRNRRTVEEIVQSMTSSNMITMTGLATDINDTKYGHEKIYTELSKVSHLIRNNINLLYEINLTLFEMFKDRINDNTLIIVDGSPLKMLNGDRVENVSVTHMPTEVPNVGLGFTFYAALGVNEGEQPFPIGVYLVDTGGKDTYNENEYNSSLDVDREHYDGRKNIASTIILRNCKLAQEEYFREPLCFKNQELILPEKMMTTKEICKAIKMHASLDAAVPRDSKNESDNRREPRNISMNMMAAFNSKLSTQDLFNQGLLFISPNMEIKIFLCFIVERLKNVRPLFVFDRGFNSQQLLNFFDRVGIRYLVRIDDDRLFYIGENKDKYYAKNFPSQRNCLLKADKYTRKVLKKSEVEENLANNEKMILGSIRAAKVMRATDSKIKNKKPANTSEVMLVEYTPNKKSYKTEESSKKLYIITNDVNLSLGNLKKLVCAYFLRWRIETFFQQVKKIFDLDGMKYTSIVSIQNILALVFLTSAVVLKFTENKKDERTVKNIASRYSSKTQVFLRTYFNGIRRILKNPIDLEITDYRNKVIDKISEIIGLKICVEIVS